MLLCLLSRKILWIFFPYFAWEFCIEKGWGIFGEFFLVSVSWEAKHENSSKNSGKIRSKIRGKIRDENSKKFGKLSFCHFSDLMKCRNRLRRGVQAVLDGVPLTGVATLKVRKGAFNALNEGSGALAKVKYS